MLSADLEKLLNENKWDDAILLIKSYSNPLTIELLDKLGWCYSRSGKYKKAIEVYNELINRESQKAKWHYCKGYQFYAESKWAEAIDCFVKALELHNNYLIVKYRLAYAYIQTTGNHQQWTKDSFWKAIQQLEDCHSLYQSYSEQEKANNASTYADVCFLHGKVIMASDRYIDKCISLLKKAVELRNDNDFKYQLAKALVQKKAYDEALDVLPNISKPYYINELRSSIFSAQGLYAESNKILFGLIKYRQKDYLYRRIARNYCCVEKFGNAIKYISIAIKKGPNNYKNYLAQGVIYKKMGQMKSAITAFETARNKKQKMFGTDCSEAIEFMVEINNDTNNRPQDEKISLEDKTLKECMGIIIKYNHYKGYGFIKEDETGENIFFHISNFEEVIGPKKQMKVVYNKEFSNRGACAVNISARRVSLLADPTREQLSNIIEEDFNRV